MTSNQFSAFLTAALLITGTAARAGSVSSSDSPDDVGTVRFVQPKDFIETSDLPPALKAVFDLDCNWTVLKTIREDSVQPDGKVIVNVGILVLEKDKGCDGVFENQTVDAGTLFSGGNYEVKAITPARGPMP
jgi:hypothetical protein